MELFPFLSKHKNFLVLDAGTIPCKDIGFLNLDTCIGILDDYLEIIIKN